MRYAAEFPDDLAGLVVEDMDCVPRRRAGVTTAAEQKRLEGYSRWNFSSWEALKSELLTWGYAAARIEGWAKECPPRATATWTAINPFARALACTTVLQTF